MTDVPTNAMKLEKKPKHPTPEGATKPAMTQAEADTLLVTDQPANTNEQAVKAALDAFSHIIQTNDVDRLATMADLLNTFNFAIQAQAKRQNWTAEDFRAFAIAACAMDAII